MSKILQALGLQEKRALVASFVEVPELRTETSFALDLVIEGFDSFLPSGRFGRGFSSFQIGDVSVSNGYEFMAFEKGEILKGTPDGVGGYVTKGRMVSHGVIDHAGRRHYNARFGGYGSSARPEIPDGTLYRFYFDGELRAGPVVELENFFFSIGRRFPMNDVSFQYVLSEPSNLRNAAETLYDAGRWEIAEQHAMPMEEQDAMWKDLDDALKN